MDSSNSRRLTGFCHTEDVSGDTFELDEEDDVTLHSSSASVEDTHSCTFEVQDEECTDYFLCMTDEEDDNQHSGSEDVSLLTTTYYICSHTGSNNTGYASYKSM